jgi:uncharacterized membrane protein
MTTQTSRNTLSTNWDPARLIGVALAAVGLLNAVYLSWLHFSGGTSSLCSKGSGCDTVQNSAYSEIGGIPIALLGIAGYTLILLALLLDKRLAEWGPTIVLGASLIGTLYSAYLTYLELYVLHAVCLYCVASAVFMVGLLTVAVLRFSPNLSEPPD